MVIDNAVGNSAMFFGKIETNFIGQSGFCLFIHLSVAQWRHMASYNLANIGSANGLL